VPRLALSQLVTDAFAQRRIDPDGPLEGPSIKAWAAKAAEGMSPPESLLMTLAAGQVSLDALLWGAQGRPKAPEPPARAQNAPLLVAQAAVLEVITGAVPPPPPGVPAGTKRPAMAAVEKSKAAKKPKKNWGRQPTGRWELPEDAQRLPMSEVLVMTSKQMRAEFKSIFDDEPKSLNVDWARGILSGQVCARAYGVHTNTKAHGVCTEGFCFSRYGPRMSTHKVLATRACISGDCCGAEGGGRCTESCS